MNEDISSRYDVRSTVQNDVDKADKVDAAVERSSTNEWNTAFSRIEESTPESIFRKVVKQFDSSEQIWYLEAILLAMPPLLRSPTLSV